MIDGTFLVRASLLIALSTGLGVIGIAGCSGTAIAPAVRERIHASRDWPLSQGSVLTTSLKERVLDEETSFASIFVRHTRSAAGQNPVAKLEIRFANPEYPPEWSEFSVVTQPADAGGVQTFEFLFSAPMPQTLDFRVTIDGKTEELLGWVADWQE